VKADWKEFELIVVCLPRRKQEWPGINKTEIVFPL